jgi:glycosyltransferase involved in cell wall biosynthesis
MISGYYAVECWVALVWALLHQAPRFLWFESNEFDYPRYWVKELPKRIFVCGCQGAHVYGKSHRDYLVKLGMRPETVTFKKSVADIEKFDTAPGSREYRRDGLTRIISVGRLAPEKNLFVLLKAFARAVARGSGGLRLIVAGTGPDEAALKQLAAESGIANLVEFRGYTPQKDLGALYREGDFFVFPSTREPWGLVALEAMLCRLPVIISTKCGCAGDMVTPETGWSFDPASEAELAEIFDGLEKIPAARIARMGDAAHDLARGHSAENCAALIRRALSLSMGTGEDFRQGDFRQNDAQSDGVSYAG